MLHRVRRALCSCCSCKRGQLFCWQHHCRPRGRSSCHQSYSSCLATLHSHCAPCHGMAWLASPPRPQDSTVQPEAEARLSRSAVPKAGLGCCSGWASLCAVCQPSRQSEAAPLQCNCFADAKDCQRGRVARQCTALLSLSLKLPQFTVNTKSTVVGAPALRGPWLIIVELRSLPQRTSC